MSDYDIPTLDRTDQDALERLLADNECEHGRLPTDGAAMIGEYFKTKDGRKTACRCWENEALWI